VSQQPAARGARGMEVSTDLPKAGHPITPDPGRCGRECSRAPGRGGSSVTTIQGKSAGTRRSSSLLIECGQRATLSKQRYAFRVPERTTWRSATSFAPMVGPFVRPRWSSPVGLKSSKAAAALSPLARRIG
jgi:hypothetical protein